jgi:transposase
MRKSGLISEMSIHLEGAELEGFLARLKGLLSPGDFALVESMAETIRLLMAMLQSAKTSVKRLRDMVFGPKTEKAETVLKDGADGEADPAKPPPTDDASAPVREKRKGHGRHGGNDYPGGTRRRVPHERLHAGEACPCCHKGKLYELKEPGIWVFVKGQAPFAAEVWETMRLRCSRCTEVFTAALPEEVGKEKFDVTAGSMMALMKYGCGFPFFRVDRLQNDFAMPFPPATQWGVVVKVAEKAEPVFLVLIRVAAQGKVLYSDDTKMRILEILKERAERKLLPVPQTEAAEERASPKDPERTGVFTTGVVSEVEGHRIALFFTGTKYAGENLARVLDDREPGRSPPIAMSDGLAANVPKGHSVIEANCLIHGRRNFVEIVEDFPPECRFAIECLKGVYENEAEAKKLDLPPEGRLGYHQERSALIMEALELWLAWKIEDQVIEPNSGLGQAIKYMRKRWQKLTLFLRMPGSPLDNNIAERILKMAILHRKNSYFYKTRNGARVGDILMTVIDTCRLEGVNPFEYLNALQRHAARVREKPAEWLPWSYEAALAQLTATKAVG